MGSEVSEANQTVAHPQGRKRLPNRRQAVRQEVEFDPQAPNGSLCTVSIGFGDDLRPAEVFISTRKRGSTLDAFCNDAAILLSLALQHGAEVADIAHSLGRTADGRRTSVLGTAIDFAAAVAAENAKMLGAE